MRYENPATGEVIEFLSESPDLLVMQATWPRPGQRAARHAHPGMQERWEVLQGCASVEIEGVLHELQQGQSVVAEPGDRHLAWNASNDTTIVRIEMRPALRWSDFVRRLFAGESPMALLAEFSDEVRIA